jgi:hypothetical protein
MLNIILTYFVEIIHCALVFKKIKITLHTLYLYLYGYGTVCIVQDSYALQNSYRKFLTDSTCFFKFRLERPALAKYSYFVILISLFFFLFLILTDSTCFFKFRLERTALAKYSYFVILISLFFFLFLILERIPTVVLSYFLQLT